ncbi:hypothetical protein CAEBREN_03077 [Caenorhabditis brenneri]|uniref:Uncharacterized protein n=1 Tax=Caenorhabditis brenneri TaxID=135651 RepID=G0MQQ3_CAEBE|nr:hypothetical protein CAEBREN_03077 [Caenorhabditis brenneri]
MNQKSKMFTITIYNCLVSSWQVPDAVSPERSIL